MDMEVTDDLGHGLLVAVDHQHHLDYEDVHLHQSGDLLHHAEDMI